MQLLDYSIAGSSRADIEGALQACRELMNSLDLHFRNATVGYEQPLRARGMRTASSTTSTAGCALNARSSGGFSQATSARLLLLAGELVPWDDSKLQLRLFLEGQPLTGKVHNQVFTVNAPPGVDPAAVQAHLKDIRDNTLLVAPDAAPER